MKARRTLPFLVSGFSFLAVLACACQPVESDLSARDRAIDSLYREFSAGYAALDHERVAALYAPDALYGTPGSPGYVRGRGPIRADFQSFFDAIRRDSANLNIRFRFIERRHSPTLATDVGLYALTTRRGDSTRAGAGKFVTILAPDSAGKWRFVLDTYSDASLEAFEATPPFTQ